MSRSALLTPLMASALLSAVVAGLVAGPVFAPAADGIKGAWVRVNPAPGRPAAGYFSFKNGARADRLLEARAQDARVQIHSVNMEKGMMRMQKLEGLAVEAGETVIFKPGGYHLMLFDLKPGVKAVPITLVFSSGAQITTNAEVRSAALAAPAAP